MTLTAAAANGALAMAAAPAYARFRRSLRDPSAAQETILRRLLADNAATAFGAAHGFGTIRMIDDYRRQVPVRTFDELRPWIRAVEHGHAGALTRDRGRGRRHGDP